MCCQTGPVFKLAITYGFSPCVWLISKCPRNMDAPSSESLNSPPNSYSPCHFLKHYFPHQLAISSIFGIWFLMPLVCKISPSFHGKKKPHVPLISQPSYWYPHYIHQWYVVSPSYSPHTAGWNMTLGLGWFIPGCATLTMLFSHTPANHTCNIIRYPQHVMMWGA